MSNLLQSEFGANRLVMKKADIIPMPEYFDRYINLVDDELTIIEALKHYGPLYIDQDVEQMKALEKQVYAQGKWTVHDILQHLIDNERIFNYRALCFARNDDNILPGHDENMHADMGKASNRNLEDILEEFYLLRQSTVALFKSFDDEMLQRSGICFQKKMSVLALGFTISGHAIHHMNVLRERYYPLLDK